MDPHTVQRATAVVVRVHGGIAVEVPAFTLTSIASQPSEPYLNCSISVHVATTTQHRHGLGYRRDYFLSDFHQIDSNHRDHDAPPERESTNCMLIKFNLVTLLLLDSRALAMVQFNCHHWCLSIIIVVHKDIASRQGSCFINKLSQFGREKERRNSERTLGRRGHQEQIIGFHHNESNELHIEESKKFTASLHYSSPLGPPSNILI